MSFPSGGHRLMSQPDRGAAKCEDLRMQLAQLKRQAALEEHAKRVGGEELLGQVVELRSEQRTLSHEMRAWHEETHAAANVAASSRAALGDSAHELRRELAYQQGALGAAREQINQLSASSVLEDDPDEELAAWQQECARMLEEGNEYDDSRAACQELSERLAQRIGSLEEEVAHARTGLKVSRVAQQAKITQDDILRLRSEVKILRAKVGSAAAEVNAEAKTLWLTSEAELPRLRMQELERRKLQKSLAQAHWDNDRLQQDYDRVIRGLQEQEEVQRASEQELSAEIADSRAEGEEMISAMTKVRQRLAELRTDSSETESFMKHLSGQVEHLEAERNKLRASFADAKPGAGQHSALADMEPSARQASLAWMRQDHARLVQELRAASARDEEEARVVRDACQEMEVRLVHVEQRNMQKRLEAVALSPMTDQP